MSGPIGYLDPIPRKKGGKTPPEGVLSVTRGIGRKPMDFDWLEKNIPCQAACPAGTDIPGYLGAISNRDYETAYRLNLRDNVFPGVLGRVCTRPCEPACRHGWEGLGDPVAICFAKRSADDFQSRTEPVLLEKIFPPSGKRVAVIGSGAAGLTLARELALWGHAVEVFERHAAPGGLMVQGIPEFRLPRSTVEREIRQVLDLGVTVHCGQSIDSTSALEDLQSKFDAAVLAFGAWKPVLPDLPGMDAPAIQHGLPFLMSVNGGARPSVGARVLVIGGGFTAVDCTRMALRLGAQEVTMVYRRTREAMYISGHELRTMDDEGIHFKEQLAPVRFEEKEDGSIRAVFARTVPGPADANGRSGFILNEDDTETIQADLVLLGTGQKQDWSWLPGSMQGDLQTEGRSGNLFIAGDAFSGPGSLIDAIGHAKSVARSLDEFLTGARRLTDAVVIQDAVSTGRTKEMDRIPRQAMPEHQVSDRELSCEVETGLTEPEAILEAQRCYLCNIKFEIDNDLCIYCDRCLKVMPVDNCIVKVNRLHHDEQGRITGCTESSSSRDYNLLFIDQSACIRCGACAEVCPVECISLQRVDKKTFRTEDL